MTKIQLKEEKFYILVGDVFAVYDNQDEAVKDLKGEIKKNENATVAKISYERSKDKSKQGTFNVNPLSWKDIAMGWVK